MRQVGCLYTAVLLSIGTQVFAAATTVTTQVDVQSTQQPLGISQLQSSPQTQNIRSTVGVATDKIGKGFALDAKVMLDAPDYSSVLLRDNQNQEKKLAVDYKNQIQTEARLSYSKGSIYASAGFFGHLSQSPYLTKGGFVEFEKGFFEKTSLLGIQFGFFQQNRPEDYFNDRDGFLKARPTSVNAQEVNLHYEQILSERLKTRLTASTAKKVDERPRNYGLEAKAAYAISQRLFARVSSGYFQEVNSEPLLNERGYFKAFINQVEFTLEPTYDFFVSASYGFSAEVESDPRSQTSTQVGVDQYGLGLKYGLKAMSLFLNGAWSQSNSLTSSMKVSGGVTWTL